MTYSEDIMQAARELYIALAKTDFQSEILPKGEAACRSGEYDQDQEMQVIAAAIATERARHQWQPIATAPQDGTRILLRGGSIQVPDLNKRAYVPCSAAWDGEDWVVDDEGGEYYWALYRGATEWKPIEPPQEAST